VAGIAVGVSGYVVLTTILVALGLLLTKVLLDGSVGRWDYALDRWFFLQRQATFDAITEWGSMLGDTMAVAMPDLSMSASDFPTFQFSTMVGDEQPMPSAKRPGAAWHIDAVASARVAAPRV